MFKLQKKISFSICPFISSNSWHKSLLWSLWFLSRPVYNFRYKHNQFVNSKTNCFSYGIVSRNKLNIISDICVQHYYVKMWRSLCEFEKVICVRRNREKMGTRVEKLCFGVIRNRTRCVCRYEKWLREEKYRLHSWKCEYRRFIFLFLLI